MELNKNKETSRNISKETLKTIARDICVPLTECINSAILNDFYPNELKARLHETRSELKPV